MTTVPDPVLDHLATLGIDYEVVPCNPQLSDTAAFCDAYGYRQDDSVNAIVVIGKSATPMHVMCLVLATTRLDVNRAVRKRLGVRRASFASAEQTRDLTGMEIGGVTPFGSAASMPIWIDTRVTERERVILGGGSRDRKILVPPAALTVHPDAEVVDQLATPLTSTP
jgi:prolyl-tRNA editing enzyme YbaK/EbsC (Cys-tRNA(Pro) deacylase)